MPWTRPRFWPTWPAHLQSDRGWAPPAYVFRPHLSCTSPAPGPCLAFGHVGLLRGKAQGSPSLPLCTTPSPRPHPQTVLLRLQLDKGDSGLSTPGGDKEGSEGALLPPTAPPSHLPCLSRGVTLVPLAAMMALCMDIAGHWEPSYFFSFLFHLQKSPDAEGKGVAFFWQGVGSW